MDGSFSIVCNHQQVVYAVAGKVADLSANNSSRSRILDRLTERAVFLLEQDVYGVPADHNQVFFAVVVYILTDKGILIGQRVVDIDAFDRLPG